VSEVSAVNWSGVEWIGMERRGAQRIGYSGAEGKGMEFSLVTTSSIV
jgi:hypothetical protein